MTTTAPTGPLTAALRADFRDDARAAFAQVMLAAGAFARCDTLAHRSDLDYATGVLGATLRDWRVFGFCPFAPSRSFTRPKQRLYAAAVRRGGDPAACRDELREAARGLFAGEGRG
jgi:hypothetical protein